MNFTNKIKNEIYNQKIESDCCYLALLYSIVLTQGEIGISAGEFYLSISSTSVEFLQFTTKIIKKLYGQEFDVESASETSFNKEKFEVEINFDISKKIFSDFGILDSLGRDKSFNFEFNANLLSNECCNKSFLKGVFLATGTTNIKTTEHLKTGSLVSETTSQGYHLEEAFTRHSLALEVSGLFAQFNINSKIITRKSFFILYLTGYENIKTFLVELNLNKSLFELEDENITRDMRRKLNMGINLDTANFNKQQNAYFKQVEAIKTIDEILGLSSLDEKLQELAKLRLEQPDFSLEELAAQSKYKVSKSGINHRMRKLLAIYETIK